MSLLGKVFLEPGAQPLQPRAQFGVVPQEQGGQAQEPADQPGIGQHHRPVAAPGRRRPWGCCRRPGARPGPAPAGRGPSARAPRPRPGSATGAGASRTGGSTAPGARPGGNPGRPRPGPGGKATTAGTAPTGRPAGPGRRPPNPATRAPGSRSRPSSPGPGAAIRPARPGARRRSARVSSSPHSQAPSRAGRPAADACRRQPDQRNQSMAEAGRQGHPGAAPMGLEAAVLQQFPEVPGGEQLAPVAGQGTPAGQGLQMQRPEHVGAQGEGQPAGHELQPPARESARAAHPPGKTTDPRGTGPVPGIRGSGRHGARSKLEPQRGVRLQVHRLRAAGVALDGHGVGAAGDRDGACRRRSPPGWDGRPPAPCRNWGRSPP